MRVLALEIENPDASSEDFAPLLNAEARKVAWSGLAIRSTSISQESPLKRFHQQCRKSVWRLRWINED